MVSFILNILKRLLNELSLNVLYQLGNRSSAEYCFLKGNLFLSYMFVYDCVHGNDCNANRRL